MSRLQLQEITIQGYKSFKNQSLKLTGTVILIGQNGAGKSNFISLFRLLRNTIEDRLRSYSQKQGVDRFFYYGSKHTDQILVDIFIGHLKYSLALRHSSYDSFLYIEHEVMNDLSVEGYDEFEEGFVNFSSAESGLKRKATIDNNANVIYQILNSIRVYHFQDTTETAGVKGYSSITDNRFLFEDASNLASFLYRIKLTGAAYYERIVKTVQLVMPFFKDFVLEPNFQNVETIRLEWQDKYSDKVFTAHDLSDGSLRFICMATLLLQETLPSVVLLDEPEIGLHPSAITILAGLLKKASKRTQVIVSTQSVSLVNEFDAEDIVVVERPAEETIMRRLDAEKLSAWLEEYSLGDLWDKNVLGGNP